MSDKYVVLSNLSIKLYRNNKFNTSAPTLNNKFELTNGSCSLSDIQDYFEYKIKKNMKH